jgi:deazaflavin-dependent oxidoreductase (nitroreductase family)
MPDFYNRPGRLIQLSNRLFGWLAGNGIGPKKTVDLEVRGRRSGEPRRTAVNLVEYEGARYLVAPRGNTEWSRNARAAGEAVIHRRGSEKVRLTELPAGQRAPVIQKYLEENAFVTKREFGIEPDSPLEEFERIAELHPVFRIEPVR